MTNDIRNKSLPWVSLVFRVAAKLTLLAAKANLLLNLESAKKGWSTILDLGD